MADGCSVTIRGLDELMVELNQLPGAIQKKLIKSATATACSVIRAEAVARAPEWTGDVTQGHPPPGTLKKAIYQARVSAKCTQVKEVWVVNVHKGNGVRHGGKTSSKFGPTQGVSKDAFYASWVEHGHYARQAVTLTKGQRKGMQATGKVQYIPPRPFMRPAFEIKKVEAEQAFRRYLTENLPLALQGMRLIKYKP